MTLQEDILKVMNGFVLHPKDIRQVNEVYP
jgi:hypothetical protein